MSEFSDAGQKESQAEYSGDYPEEAKKIKSHLNDLVDSHTQLIADLQKEKLNIAAQIRDVLRQESEEVERRVSDRNWQTVNNIGPDRRLAPEHVDQPRIRSAVPPELLARVNSIDYPLSLIASIPAELDTLSSQFSGQLADAALQHEALEDANKKIIVLETFLNKEKGLERPHEAS